MLRVPNTCYSIRTRKQLPMMRFLKNPEAEEFQFLRYSRWWLRHQDAPSWHVYLYVFGPANLNSRNSTIHHPLIIRWRIRTSRPKARRRNQNPPRHTSPFQKRCILLMLTLLVPMPISFQNWAQAVPSHGQQLPNLSLSCQTASFVELTIPYNTDLPFKGLV